MKNRTWSSVAFTLLSIVTLTAYTLPSAYAQEDFLDSLRAAANGKGEVVDDGKGTVDDGKGDDKGKGKPPVTPQPPSVPSTGPESTMAIMLVASAAYATWRYSKNAQSYVAVEA